MIVTIPTFNDPFYTFSTELEGRSYVFDFRYNQRENAWYFSVALDDGTELIGGVKVVCGFDLLRKAADVRLPPGLLIAIPNGKDNSTPGLGELGESARVTLTYFTSDDPTLSS